MEASDYSTFFPKALNAEFVFRWLLAKRIELKSIDVLLLSSNSDHSVVMWVASKSLYLASFYVVAGFPAVLSNHSVRPEENYFECCEDE